MPCHKSRKRQSTRLVSVPWHRLWHLKTRAYKQDLTQRNLIVWSKAEIIHIYKSLMAKLFLRFLTRKPFPCIQGMNAVLDKANFSLPSRHDCWPWQRNLDPTLQGMNIGFYNVTLSLPSRHDCWPWQGDLVFTFKAWILALTWWPFPYLQGMIAGLDWTTCYNKVGISDCLNLNLYQWTQSDRYRLLCPSVCNSVHMHVCSLAHHWEPNSVKETFVMMFTL